MSTLQLIFQAYIPKSLGKPLLSYFSNDPLFNQQSIENYAWFKSKLEESDSRGYTWIPEPMIGSYIDTYFATDPVDNHDHHSSHSSRLSVEMTLDPAKVGHYQTEDLDSMFFHLCGDGTKKNKTQHSSYSHRVTAKIKSSRGIFEEEEKRSPEQPLTISRLENIIKNTYIHDPRTPREDLLDATVVEFSAAAAYPFLPGPDIDFRIEVMLHRVSPGLFQLSFSGRHNRFPAYELVVDNDVLYKYSPLQHGQTGPSPLNLGDLGNVSLRDYDLGKLGNQIPDIFVHFHRVTWKGHDQIDPRTW